MLNRDDGEENQVVGWPPIKQWRQKMLFPDHQHYGHGHHDLQNHQIVAKENDGPANSMYIKVKMEGVGILRKIDIKLHHSYQTLRDSLITMFAKCKCFLYSQIFTPKAPKEASIMGLQVNLSSALIYILIGSSFMHRQRM